MGGGASASCPLLFGVIDNYVGYENDAKWIPANGPMVQISLQDVFCVTYRSDF
jgi:hypothetical protein